MKNKNTIISIVVVVLLLVGVYFLSNIANKSYLEEITFANYKELIKSEEEVYVFVSEDKDYEAGLKKLGKSLKKNIYYLDASALNEEYSKEVYGDDGKASVLFTYKKGEVVNKKDATLKYITVDEYLKISKSEGYNFIFIGSASCGYCVKFQPELKNVLLTEDANIYYLDLSTLTEDEMNSLYNSDSYFTTEEWGTPLNFLFKDGERVAVLNGYTTADEVINFLKTNNAL